MALWLTVDMPEQRAVIDQALDTVVAVATADFWTAARGASEAHEEAPFAVRETANGLPQVLNGAIDLVYRAADGWEIVDYKTDIGATAADLASKYGGQLGAYEQAWRRVSGAAGHGRLEGVRRKPE